MATKALRMLAHIAALRTRLRRGNQAGEHALVASNWSLQNISHKRHFEFLLKQKHFTEVTASLNYLCNTSQN